MHHTVLPCMLHPGQMAKAGLLFLPLFKMFSTNCQHCLEQWCVQELQLAFQTALYPLPCFLEQMTNHCNHTMTGQSSYMDLVVEHTNTSGVMMWVAPFPSGKRDVNSTAIHSDFTTHSGALHVTWLTSLQEYLCCYRGFGQPGLPSCPLVSISRTCWDVICSSQNITDLEQ